MLHGMVFKKEAEGDITSVKDAKIAVFSCPFDCMVTETKVITSFLLLSFGVSCANTSLSFSLNLFFTITFFLICH